MNKLPCMPFFVDDYARDTSHLSLEEHGAYLLLLISMWRNRGSIPDDDRAISRMLGLPLREWKKLRPRLDPFLETYAGVVTQSRLQKNWNYAVENSARQSAKGKVGAKVRYEKEQLLRSSPGYSPGQAAVNGRGHSHGYSTGNAPAIASKKERYNLPSLLVAEGKKEGAEEGPETTAPTASRLLSTPLMRRTAG